MCTLPVAAVQASTALQINDILRTYNTRNITTVYHNQYPVWQVGCGWWASRARLRLRQGGDT